MKLVQAFIIAFAMYSKIPMPKTDWSETNMKYAICFFPLVGAVIGAVYAGAFYLCNFLQFGNELRAAVLISIPILITGGIHADGFIDTMDARSSYAERERKLEILKDSHVGAFAVIGSIVYFILNIGFASEISEEVLMIIVMSFVYSRALSGLSMVTFQKAKKDGLLVSFSEQAAKKTVQIAMGIVLAVVMFGMTIVNNVIGSFCILTGWGIFFYYKQVAYKEFGGTTGDLAGYFLQLCELGILITAVTIGAVMK